MKNPPIGARENGGVNASPVKRFRGRRVCSECPRGNTNSRFAKKGRGQEKNDRIQTNHENPNRHNPFTKNNVERGANEMSGGPRLEIEGRRIEKGTSGNVTRKKGLVISTERGEGKKCQQQKRRE